MINHRSPDNSSSSSSSSPSSVNPSSPSVRDGHRSFFSPAHHSPSKFNIGFLLHRSHHHSPVTSSRASPPSSASSSSSAAAANHSIHFGFQRKSHVFDDVVRPPHRYVQSVTTIAVLTGIFVLLTVGATIFVALFCCKRNLVFAFDEDEDREDEREDDDVCEMEDLEAAAAASAASAAAVSDEGDYEDIEPLFPLGGYGDLFAARPHVYLPLRGDFERTGSREETVDFRPAAKSRVQGTTDCLDRPIGRGEEGPRRPLGMPNLGLEHHRDRQLTVVENPVEAGNQRFREAIHLTGCIPRQKGYQRVMMEEGEEEKEGDEEEDRELERVKGKEIYFKENVSKDPSLF